MVSKPPMDPFNTRGVTMIIIIISLEVPAAEQKPLLIRRRKIVFNPGAGLLPLTGRKAHDKCVNYVDQLDYSCKTRGNFSRQLDHDFNCYRLRFTAGSQRPPHEESYLALLGYGGDKNTAEWRCAGTIISENFILTAAHCLTVKPLGPVKYVAVGITNRLDTSEWQTYDVQKVFSHPDYDTNFKYHDIALIKTESIKFNQHVLPACLHSDPETLDTSEAGILVWNSTDEVLDQGKLQVFPLDEFDEVQCSFFYPPHPELPSGFDASSQICYGDVRTPQDSCQKLQYI
ncbi:unnamed protein product [Spodoptera exigua]|nr:unnamed protein product [Spodoptera exigua]